MSVELIYVLSLFHMLFLSILYPNSCKTQKISFKFGFVGFLMESKLFSKKRCKIFSKGELTECLTTRHWEDKYFCIIWSIKWFNSTYGCILHSKIFPTTRHTLKSELKRRSYGLDKLEKKNWLLSRKNVATKQKKKKLT